MAYELPEWAIPLGTKVRSLNSINMFDDTVTGHVFDDSGLASYVVTDSSERRRLVPLEFAETERTCLVRRLQEARDATAKLEALLAESEVQVPWKDGGNAPSSVTMEVA